MLKRTGRTNEENFAAVDKSDVDACWPWPGRLSWRGYGEVGKLGMAHRWVYTMLVGEILSGKVLDHHCHNDTACRGGNRCPHRACVNPRHLTVKTQGQNLADSHVIQGYRSSGSWEQDAPPRPTPVPGLSGPVTYTVVKCHAVKPNGKVCGTFCPRGQGICRKHSA